MLPLLANLYGGRSNMSFQKPRPYICSDPECGASYVRREHLLRHEAQHSEAQAHVCKVCGIGFSRSDSLRRHERTHSKNTSEPIPRVGKACDRCHALKARCDKGNPCAICAKRGLQCTFDRSFKRESRSASILSGTEYEELQAGRKRRRVDQDMPDRLLGMNGLYDAVAASSSSHTPTPPPPPTYTAGPPSKLQQTQSQAEAVSMQNLRIAVRQHEAQIQHDLMNVGDQPSPTQHQHQEQDADHPIFQLLDVYIASKSFLATDNISSDLESKEMADLMSDLDAKHYVELYFSHFHSQWPFLSRPQFNPETEPPILVLAMVMCGLRMTKEKSLMRLAWAIHAHLQAIFVTQMDNWTVKEYSSHRWPIATYQAILLFAIFAVTANDYTEVFGSDEEEDEEDVLDRIYPIFTYLVDTCRVQRILHYPSMLSQIHADDPLVYKLNASEEFKYFALTLFKVDNILSKLIQLGRNNDSNQPDVGYTALAISDLQFPPPVNNYLWEADGIREFLRRRTRQCRDPSRSSQIYSAVMADDRETSLNRELNPWICDILRAAETKDTKELGEMQVTNNLGRKRRKAWMSLGPWLGYLVGLDVGSALI